MCWNGRIALLIVLSVSSSAVAHDRIIGVASVVDGDTIEIHGQRIRLFGIDAPESNQLCVRPTGERWRCGQQASFALADRIGLATVSCQPRDLDRYGRVVAICFAANNLNRTAVAARCIEHVRRWWAMRSKRTTAQVCVEHGKISDFRRCPAVGLPKLTACPNDSGLPEKDKQRRFLSKLEVIWGMSVNSPLMKSISDQSVSDATMMTNMASSPSISAIMTIANAISI